MISVTGIGWISRKEFGCIKSGIRESYSYGEFPKQKIFSYPNKNFGRLDNVSKMTCAAAALALKDAGIDYSPGLKHDMGIVSTNASGCMETDIHYFKDYLDCGRTLARGNLFIYTLPSSPSGEAAIYFGLQGPLLYITHEGRSVVTAVETASGMILGRDASMMIAGTGGEEHAIYFVLINGYSSGANVLCDIERAEKILRKKMSFSRLIKEFSNLRKVEDV